MELTINNLLKVFGGGLGFDIRLAGKYDKLVTHHVKMEIWYWGEGDPNYPGTWKWDKVYTAPTVLQCLHLFLSDMRSVELPGHIDLSVFGEPHFVISKELSRACLDALKDDSGRIKPGRIIEVPAQFDWARMIGTKKKPATDQEGSYRYAITMAKPFVPVPVCEDRLIDDLRKQGSLSREMNAKLQEAEPEEDLWFDEYYDSLPDAD